MISPPRPILPPGTISQPGAPSPQPLPSSCPADLLPLPIADHFMLTVMRSLVPPSQRQEWARSWHAELWCNHHQAPRRGGGHSLFFGLLHDALWLRTESYRAALAGTAILCLLLLSAMVMLAGLPLLAISGDLHVFTGFLLGQVSRFSLASPLIVFVSCATSSRYIQHDAAGLLLRWLKSYTFLAAKIVLLLLFTFLLSTDLCLPLHLPAPFAAFSLQMPCFVVFALLALRWNFHDADLRCKHCLRSLTGPSRVGRPSHNFLEWNGTELLCRDGHGLLSVPELETSWCRSSRWISQPFGHSKFPEAIERVETPDAVF